MAGNESCSYCGWALDDPYGGMVGMNTPVQISCEHGGQVHGHYVLERAERTALGNADPRPCLAWQSEWPLGRRPPHPVELAREIPGLEEEDEVTVDVRGPTIYDESRSGILQLDQTEYQSTGVFNTFEDMLQAQGHRETAPSRLYSLFVIS